MKIAAWVGGLLILAGVALGFTPLGDCGSTFQPYDYDEYATDATLAELWGTEPPPDCTNPTYPTVPVWLLIGSGFVLLVVGGVMKANRGQETADSQDALPSGNGPPDASA